MQWGLEAMKLLNMVSGNRRTKSKLRLIPKLNKDGTFKEEKQEGDLNFLMKNFAVLQNDEAIFYINEHCSGVTLQDFVFQLGNFQSSEITYYIAKILKIFQEVNIYRRIVHRNYNLTSFLIVINGEVKLYDYFKCMTEERSK